MLPEAAALAFSNPLSVYFGNMQNGADNAGQAATYSRVQVKGVALSPEIDETFAGSDLNPDPLNPKWRVVGDVPNCVFIVRADHKYWVNWSIPDSGFSLQSSPSLAPGSWTDPGSDQPGEYHLGKSFAHTAEQPACGAIWLFPHGQPGL